MRPIHVWDVAETVNAVRAKTVLPAPQTVNVTTVPTVWQASVPVFAAMVSARWVKTVRPVPLIAGLALVLAVHQTAPLVAILSW